MTTETVTLITVVGGFVFKAIQDHLTWKRSEWSAQRRRRDDSEDRERVRLDLKRTIDQKHDVIVQKLDDNTALTSLAADKAVEAYNQANNFNQKWSLIEDMFRRVQRDTNGTPGDCD